MKFIVSSTKLQRQLQTISGVLNTSNTLPILDHVLFELVPQQLKITATDLETTISTTIKVESTSEGKLAVPAKLLLDTVKTFPEQPLTFSQAENNTLEISSEQGKYALAYANADEYPQAADVVDASSLTIQGDTLATAINNTMFASGNDDLRPVMSGVFFQLSSTGMTFVATDAHKLVKYEITDLVAPETAEFIMPKKPLNLLKSVLIGSKEDVTVNYNNSNIQFSFDNIVVICRLIDGKYPNYEAVIPKENPNVMSINRVQLLNTVKRVSIFSNKTTHQIRLRIAGAELHISAEDIDYSNKAEERLTCSYQGDDIQIGFNARFLTEMLSNLSSDEIQLELSLPNRAGIITPVDGVDKGEQVTMLVMPVMLNN
jgi:DNA polymerase-3 subunit beta